MNRLFLLVGYGLGVGVMIVLLSVGEAMLDQSRDVSLIGGGELTVPAVGQTVILTRARQGMIIFVPQGSLDDPTRPPTFYLSVSRPEARSSCQKRCTPFTLVKTIQS